MVFNYEGDTYTALFQGCMEAIGIFDNHDNYLFEVPADNIIYTPYTIRFASGRTMSTKKANISEADLDVARAALKTICKRAA